MSIEKKPFTWATPEEVGIPSDAILKYIDRLEEDRMHIHSLVILRGGKLVCEGYWKPMDENFKHRLYSCSKSYVAVAVGLLIEQGLLSLDDKAISFFPDKAPKNPHPYMAEMTIRDLLRMSTCYETGSNYHPSEPDWEATFFKPEKYHKPGQTFRYCTSGTTMLCMIIKRVTGKEFMEVLRPVFDEIGIADDAFCVQTPCGHEWGGSGVCMTARDFARFGQLCMRYGLHEGKQILPRDYMIEATTNQIPNWIEGTTPDNSVGYGYQFWPTRFGGFAMRGMGGQFMLALPDKDFVLVTTSYDELCQTGLRDIINGAFTLIYPHLADQPLPANEEAAARLKERTANLKFCVVQGEKTSPMAEKVSGKVYKMDEGNEMGLKTLSVSFEGDKGVIAWENATGKHSMEFGIGYPIKQEFPEIYMGRNIGKPMDKGYDCLVDAAWLSEDTLALECEVVDMYLANLFWSITFEDEYVTVQGRKHAEWFMEDYYGIASGKAE